MTDDSDSSLSSVASEAEVLKLAPIFQTAKKATKHRFPPPVVSPPRPKRPPSPPREPEFADNADIAFIVMFRSRFHETLPPKLAHLGPQDLERGVRDEPPSPQVEGLLCALLGLVLNRKKPVERGHHGRALEEAVLSQKAQWPLSWNGINPLHGNRDFNTMAATERLNLLRTLIMWSFTSSEAITALVKDRYKQTRHQDDENQPLSVQPWGIDGDKRRYFLVQGLEDTNFRVYREGSRYTKNAHWISVAGGIEELKALATKLEEVDGTQAARRLAGKIGNALPTFLATEEKRQKREARQIRNAAFKRPEPGFSLYEGRTRGKRMRYTYDDGDNSDGDDGGVTSDATSGARRSTRNQSTRNTPFEQGPTYTASGRQIHKPRASGGLHQSTTGGYGENSTDELAHGWSGEVDANGEEEEDDEVPGSGRARRAVARPATNGRAKRKVGEDYDEDDEGMSDDNDLPLSGEEWNSDANEAADDRGVPDARDDDDDDDRDEEMSEDDAEDEELERRSLIVKLSIGKGALRMNGSAEPSNAIPSQRPPITDTTNHSNTLNGSTHPQKDPASTGLSHTAAKTSLPVPNGLTAHHGDMVTTPHHQETLLGSTLSTTGAEGYPTPASTSFPGRTTDLEAATVGALNGEVAGTE